MNQLNMVTLEEQLSQEHKQIIEDYSAQLTSIMYEIKELNHDEAWRLPAFARRIDAIENLRDDKVMKIHHTRRAINEYSQYLTKEKE